MLSIQANKQMDHTHFFGQHPWIALLVIIIMNVSGYLIDFIPGTLLAQIPRFNYETAIAMKELIIFLFQMTSYSVAIYVGWLAIKKSRKNKDKKEDK